MPRIITAKQLRANKKVSPNTRFIATKEQQKKIACRLWKADSLFHLKRNGKNGGVQIKSRFSKMKALRDHLCGETLRSAALKYGITPDALIDYKKKFFRADPNLTQFLEEVLYDAAIDSLEIFSEKKNEMSATQAAMTTGIFTDKVIALRKARVNDFRPDNALPIKDLHVLQRILEAGEKAKLVRGRTIDIDEVEVAKLQDKTKDNEQT